MKECHNCSKQIANNAKKCKYCGKLVNSKGGIKKSINTKRERDNIQQLSCPICGVKYKKLGIYGDIFCDKCMKIFFDEIRGTKINRFFDKYISYDDLRRGEEETARKRSCHQYGFSSCVVCNRNNIDKTRDPNGFAGLFGISYYYKFFLCRECITKFLAAYNVGLKQGEQSVDYMYQKILANVTAKESMKDVPFEKFKRIRLQVRLLAENMSFWQKAKRTIKAMEIGDIVGILFIVFWVLVFVICGIMSLFDLI